MSDFLNRVWYLDTVIYDYLELSNRAPSVKTFLAKQISALTAAMAQCGLAAAER